MDPLVGQLASRQPLLCGRNFIVEHYMQTVQPNVFIPAMLVGTLDFAIYAAFTDLDIAKGFTRSVQM